MFLDLDDPAFVPLEGAFDVCIAGAGVAGITLATSLGRLGRRVLLLEAGGLDYSDESQDSYRGSSIGRSYFDLEWARLRFLGGSSNHWGGWCRPLDVHDFERRDFIPHSGWPIEKADLDPYLAAACEITEIGLPYDDHPLEGADGDLNQIQFKFSTPVRFGEKYRDEIAASESIVAVLNANVTDLRLTEQGDRIAAIDCAGYADPESRTTFSAGLVVIAMGGIENARMLLNCDRQMPNGLGNGNDLVGRYFMEHYHAVSGYFACDEDAWPFGSKEVYFAPTPDLMAKRRIANAGLRAGPLVTPKPGLANDLKGRLICGPDIVREFVSQFTDPKCAIPAYIGGMVELAFEQVPNWSSRITLGDEKDRFGLRRAVLDWRSDPMDARTIFETTRAFGTYLARAEIGNVKLSEWLRTEAPVIPAVGEGESSGGGWHHMGMTRMASSQTDGVVDSDSRVFGIDNLYLAGSSVFTTGGHANPTLTIIQLTLRLADHLDAVLS